VFVGIQQGTVSLWDEASDRIELRDVRGEATCSHRALLRRSALPLFRAISESDVVIYAFPRPRPTSISFVLKYAHSAAKYVAAEGRVTPDYQPATGRRDPPQRTLPAQRPRDANRSRLAMATTPSVTTKRYGGMIHPFFSLGGVIDGGRTALADAAAFLKRAHTAADRAAAHSAS
jgi:hypothetical protein